MHISLLSTDELGHLLSFFSAVDVIHFSLTCSAHYQTIVIHQPLWEQLTERDFTEEDKDFYEYQLSTNQVEHHPCTPHQCHEVQFYETHKRSILVL